MNDFRFFDLVFYGVALATIGSASFAVFSRNIVRAVFALLGTFFGVAIIYGMLAADFVAVIQLMVYVGGILMLLIFAVMLTSQITTVQRSNRTGSWALGVGAGVCVAVLVVGIAVSTPWIQSSSLPVAESTTEAVGALLVQRYIVAFLVVGLVLMASVIGSVSLARFKKKNEL